MLLEDIEDNELLSLSFKGTYENASGVSLYLTLFLTSNGIEKNIENRVAVSVEEIALEATERMKTKKKDADIDIRIFC